jgi:hypothetical protein
VAAALWDLVWDLGGGWSAQLSRRDKAGAVLPVTPPCVLEIRHVDEPSSATPRLVVTGDVLVDGSKVVLTATPEQVAALGRGRYEHRIMLGAAPPIVFIRGYLTVRDTVGG